MDKSRNYILDRITSKKTTTEEFNFDALQAPPLGMFFSPYDIQELHSIATSIKLAAKPQERYAAIDRVCKRRGLVKFGSGTNRVVYRHPEFPDILFKIAADDVGLGDNPAEFRNQWILKPFVAKTFEITPCGTVALVERLIPITSREEFISVADDVFELITEWLIGEYVLADIGAKYFMNHGIRLNFGVCLLDYSYCYKLDGNKLFCKKKDPTSPTGTCDGEIDYDDAFSKLVCTKCGAVYKAKELELKMKNSEIIAEGKRNNMRIKISGGTNNTGKKVIENGNSNFKEQKDAIRLESVPNAAAKVNNSDNKVSISFGGNKNKKGDSPIKVSPKFIPANDKFVNGVSEKKADKPVKMVLKEEFDIPVEEEPEKKVEEVVEEPVVKEEEKPVETEAAVEEEVKPVVEVEKKTITPAITISEKIKEEAIANKKEEPTKGPAQIVDELVDKIEEVLDTVTIDALKNDMILRMIDIAAKHIAAKDTAVFAKLSNILANVYDNLEAFDEAFSDEAFINMITNVFKTNTNITNVKLNNEESELEIAYEVQLLHSWDDKDEPEELGKMESGILSVSTDEIVDAINSSKDGTYEGYKNYHAKIINIKNLFPTEKISRNVIALYDDDNQYASICGNIILGTDLDDKYIDSLAVVSKDWLDNLYDDTPEAVEETAEKAEEEAPATDPEKVEV